MKEETKKQVESIISNKFQFLIVRYNREIDKRVSEFNNIWFNKTIPSIDVFDSLCHSIKISFGKVYEDIIKLIAKENFEILPKKLKGFITKKTLGVIRTIVDENRYDKKLNIPEEFKRIRRAQENSRIRGKTMSTNVDVVLKKNNNLYLIEIKSGGKHDIGKAQKIKDENLTNFALGISNVDNVKSFVALTYNPAGEEKEFSWGFMKSFFINKENMLIGKDFWNFVGQNDKTYSELVEIFDNVGTKYEKELLGVINKHLNKIENPNKVKISFES